MSNDQTARTQQALREIMEQSKASALFRGIQANPSGYEVMETKMVRDIETDAAIRGEEPVNSEVQNDIFLKSALVASIERIRDSQNTLQLLPDIKQVLEIMIGSILSPKDMTEPVLTYRSKAKEFDSTATPLLQCVKNYFSSSYKLEGELDEILWDILGHTGSYPLAVLPESTVDYMINSNTSITVESLKLGNFETDGTLKPLGFLKSPSTEDVSVENFNILDFVKNTTKAGVTYDKTLLDEALNISVVDNFDALKIPALKRKIAEQSTHAIIAKHRESINSDHARQFRANSNSSLEAFKLEDTADYTKVKRDVANLSKLYPDRQFVSTPVLRVKDTALLERETIGHPTVIKLPTESVIPIFNPMKPRDHIGYYVLIDPTGFAVRFADVDSMIKMVQQSSNTMVNSGVSSYLLQQAVQGYSTGNGMGNSNDEKQQALLQSVSVFQQNVERDLLDRINTGSIGTGYQLGDLDAPVVMMLARALKGKATQLLYVPAQLMSYMAVDYDNHGLGKTLLDDSKLLAALRSLNQMVNSIASSKNAITRRVLNFKIPPAEKNPEKAVRIMMNEYIKGMYGDFPLTNSPVDQINYIQRAGIGIHVEDHPRYPNAELNIDYNDNQYKEINTDYDEWLKKQHIRSFGFSPELIEGSSGTDFATQTIFANVLTARRIRTLSNKFTPNLGDFIRKFTYNSSILFDELVNLVKANKIGIKRADGSLLTPEEIVTRFIQSIEVTLPAADTTQIKEQKEALDMMSDFYEKAIEQFFDPAYLSETALAELGGSENIDAHKAYIKAYYMRQWMKENGVATELFDMLAVDKDGQPMIDFEKQYGDYLDNIGKSLLPFFKRQMVRSGNIQKNIDDYRDKLPNDPVDGSGGDSYGGDDGGSDDGFDEGGDDGFDDGMPDMTGVDDTGEGEGEGEGDGTNDAGDTDENGKTSIV